MPVVGERPETGVRIAIERDASLETPPWAYAGAVHTPQDSFPASVLVGASGEVHVTLSAGASGTPSPEELAEKVRLIVRSVYRQASADGEAPSWRIVRWRGEK